MTKFRIDHRFDNGIGASLEVNEFGLRKGLFDPLKCAQAKGVGGCLVDKNFLLKVWIDFVEELAHRPSIPRIHLVNCCTDAPFHPPHFLPCNNCALKQMFVVLIAQFLIALLKVQIGHQMQLHGCIDIWMATQHAP